MKRKVIYDSDKHETVSEVIAHRDNFFHTCWMKLKEMHPELCVDMQNIELDTAGFNYPGQENESDADNDTENDHIL